MKITKRTAWLMCALMCSAPVTGIWARPDTVEVPNFLEATVPSTFGEWSKLDEPAQIIDPATKKKLEEIYRETLARTYVNAAGDRVMLSMARSGNQIGIQQAHLPDICYPAQGFQTTSAQDDELPTAYGPIRVTRLTARMGARHEPITYWLTMGDQVVKTPKRDGLAGRGRRPRDDVARAYVAAVFVAQSHGADHVGVTDADGHDGRPLPQVVRVDVAPQNRMQAGVGLNRHDVVGTETTEKHGVVADVAAHVEVNAAARSHHGDVLELIYFPERLLSADDVRDLVRGVVALQAHEHGLVVTRPPWVVHEAGRGRWEWHRRHHNLTRSSGPRAPNERSNGLIFERMILSPAVNVYRRRMSGLKAVLQWAMLAGALALLNASLTFENLWPTLSVRLTAALSIEVALCVLERFETQSLERRALRVADARFDLALSVRIPDTAW